MMALGYYTMFSEIYTNAVREFTNSITCDIVDGIPVFSTDHFSGCVIPVKNPELPPEIIELLEIGHVGKLYSYGINFELDIDFLIYKREALFYMYRGDWWFPRNCNVCDIYIDYCIWTSQDGSMCERCYHSEPGYRRVHVSQYNILEWVQFGTSGCGEKYYININTDSSEYGAVMYINMNKDADVIRDTYTFVKLLDKWFNSKPNESEIPQVQDCLNYLYNFYHPSLLTRVFGAFCDGLYTHKYILEHPDELTEYSDEAVRRCIWIFSNHGYYMENDKSIEDDAQDYVTKKSGTRLFTEYSITNMLRYMHRLMLYKDFAYSSFTVYLHRDTINIS